MFTAIYNKSMAHKLQHPSLYGLRAFWIRGTFREMRYALEIMDRERAIYTVARAFYRNREWKVRIVQLAAQHGRLECPRWQ